MQDMLHEVLGAWWPWGCSTQDKGCCRAFNDDSEALTKAWIEHLDTTAAREDAVKPRRRQVPSPPIGVKLGGRLADDGGNDPFLYSFPTLPRERGKECQLPPSGSSALPLAVPPEFEGARHGTLSTGSCAATPVSSSVASAQIQEERRCLEICLRSFTRSMLHGIHVNVLLDDGRSRVAEAMLDSELSHIILHVPSATHPVSLKCIESISVGDAGLLNDAAGDSACNMAILGCCITLVLRGGQFLTFVFESARSREYFEMCLKVVILASEQKVPDPPYAPRQVSDSPDSAKQVAPISSSNDHDPPRFDTEVSQVSNDI